MASSSSRPGTRSGATSIASPGGVRGIRTAASESWDDDFLWQHSSSSDLHLPSATSRHHSQHAAYRETRLSTASSSSEYYGPRNQGLYFAQARTHRKASTLSASTMGSVFAQEESPPLRTRLSRSTSSSHSQTPQGTNGVSLSTTSFQEEDDEPTITLSTIVARQKTTAVVASPTENVPKRASTLPSPAPQQGKSRSMKLVLPSPTFFRAASTSSWRSNTPSLASDTCSAAHTYESGSATETDNESIEENNNEDGNTTGRWEHLSLSPDAQISTATPGDIMLGQESLTRRKRGRNTTFGSPSPRFTLSSMFGSPTLTRPSAEQPEHMPPKRLGASFFRRSSRNKKAEVSSTRAAPTSHDEILITARSRSPVTASGQQTPIVEQRESALPVKHEPQKTVRARPTTASSETSTSRSQFFGSPAKRDVTRLSPGRLVLNLARQASFDRTPKSSNVTNEFCDRSDRYKDTAYELTVSDRLGYEHDRLREEMDEIEFQGSGENQQVEMDRGPSIEPAQYLDCRSVTVHQADRSTTSLLSNQSSTSFTSISSKISNTAESTKLASLPRKLKKARPKLADASLTSVVTAANIDSLTSVQTSSCVAGPSRAPTASRTLSLSPSFAFPASPASETSQSSASSVHAENSGCTSEAITGLSEYVQGDKGKTKAAIGSYVRRTLSTKRQHDRAKESSADEGEYRKIQIQTSDTLPRLPRLSNAQNASQILHSSSCVETTMPVCANTATLCRPDVLLTPDRHENVQKLEAFFSDSGASPDQTRTASAVVATGARLLASLSKRISTDFKSNNAAVGPPERKASHIFAKVDEDVTASTPPHTDERTTASSNTDIVPSSKFMELPSDSIRKHKRPLSLSAFFARATGTQDNAKSRSRSSTLTARISPCQLATSADSRVLDRVIPSAPLSASALGGFRKPSGFLHRGTASSSNIPTAKALLDGTYSNRSSFDGLSRPPPVLQHRRSFNPLWRAETVTVLEERPGSSLSLLSETSTVRPVSSMMPNLPAVTTSIHDCTVIKKEMFSSIDSPPTRLRHRYLPSLSLTLVSGGVSSVAPQDVAPSPPKVTPPNMRRAYSENTSAETHASATQSYHLTPPRNNITVTSKLDVVDPASTPDGSPRRSNDSYTGANMTRRVSLSDLRIPQRISNAQAKIGQDLKRVKEFKEGIDELKRLRNVYRALLTSNKMPTRVSEPLAESDTADTCQDCPREFPSPGPPPSESTIRMDTSMTRIAIGYQKWWEIADVLINLADGADEQQAHGDGLQRTSRSRKTSSDRMHVDSTSRSSCETESALYQELNPALAMSRAIVRERHNPNPHNAAGVSESFEQARTILPSSPSSPSSPSQTHNSSPIQRRAPHLVRSHSTSSLSPQGGSPSAPARLGNRNALVSEGVDVIQGETHFTGLSGRQLHILQGMLTPQSTPLSSASLTMSHSVDSSPARTPSVTSISPRSQHYRNGPLLLSPFTNVDGKPRSSSSAFSSGSASSSSIASSLRRRASAKRGHVIIKNVDIPDVEDGRLSVRGTSPIPDSPPFHVSNMPPTSTFPLADSLAQICVPVESGSVTSRSASVQTSTESMAEGSALLLGAIPPSSRVSREGRLRQASRAGLLGIKGLLKTLNNNPKKDSLEGSMALCTDNDNDPPDIRIPTVQSDSSSLDFLEGDDHVIRRARRAFIADVVDAEALKQSDVSPLAGKNVVLKREGDGSSGEEEDWDRRSSDEEQSKVPHSSKATTLPSALGSLPSMSPTQNTKAAMVDRSESITMRTCAISASFVGMLVPEQAWRSRSPAKATPADTGTKASDEGLPRAREEPGMSSGLRILSDTKLALTSEAMPALLAKVMEVRRNCETCVTKLRDATV